VLACLRGPTLTRCSVSSLDEAALPNARVPCLPQCDALSATARLSQKKMLTGIAALATSPLAAQCVCSFMLW